MCVCVTLEETEDTKVKKDESESPDIGPKMQYLSLTNEEKNQYTTTSITSNLALYEVHTHTSYGRYT